MISKLAPIWYDFFPAVPFAVFLVLIGGAALLAWVVVAARYLKAARSGAPALTADKHTAPEGFYLEFSTCNAAFDVAPRWASADILEGVALRMKRGYNSGRVRDDNGNTIGRFILFSGADRPFTNLGQEFIAGAAAELAEAAALRGRS